MTDFPATDDFRNAVNQGIAQQAFEDLLAATRQMPGANGEAALVIAADAITPTRGLHSVDTEAAAASDDLKNIVTTNLPEGSHLALRQADPARVVTLKHNAGGAGEILLDGNKDFTFTDDKRVIILRHEAGGTWREWRRQRPADLAADPSLAPYLGKNRLINGGFDIVQRGPSFPSVVTEYTLDRWFYGWTLDGGARANNSVDQMAFTLGQTDVPGEPEFYCRFNGSVSGGGGTEVALFQQRIEDVRVAAGQNATVSFWAKAAGARAMAVDIQQLFGTGGSPSASVITLGTSVSLTTTWQLFTHKFAVPSITGKTLGTSKDDSLLVGFVSHSAASSGYTTVASSANDIDIANIQFEIGDVETDFEKRPRGDELEACYRYFQRWAQGSPVMPAAFGFSQSTTLVRALYPTNVQMRAAPTITKDSASTWRGASQNNADGTIGSVLVQRNGISWEETVSGFTAQNVFAFVPTVSTDFDFDAEL